jgi:hypothetical protein
MSESIETAPEWISLKELASRHESVSPWLLGELVRRGEFPSVRLGRRVLIRSDAIELLAERQRVEREANVSGRDR